MIRTTLYALLLIATAATANAAVRVYDLGPANVTEIQTALLEALRTRCNASNAPTCSAQLLPNGQMLIDANDATHAEITAVLERIAARNVGPAPRVTLRYWVVSGVAGAEDRDQAALRPLDGLLTEIERQTGPLGFKLEGHASLTSEAGKSTRLQSRPLEVTQRTLLSGSRLSADIELDFLTTEANVIQQGGQQQGGFITLPTATPSRELDLSVNIEPGEFLVLGEESFSTANRSGTLFYVVHWPKTE